MSPLRPTTTSSSPSPAMAGVSPFALLLCVLATIAAVPILLTASDQSEAEEVAVVVDETVSASALEPDIDIDALFEAGARLDAVPELDAEDDAAPAPTGTSVPVGAARASAAQPARLPETASAVEPPSTESTTPASVDPPITAPPATDPPVTAPPTTTPPTTAAPTTAAPTTAAPTTAAPTTAAPAAEQAAPNEPAATEQTQQTEPSGAPTAEQWAALRQCESSGNYSAVSSNGLYHGAYQFYQPTWDGLARQVGRTDLVGLRPSQASPADQDALALRLWEQRGSQPWPTCGRHLVASP